MLLNQSAGKRQGEGLIRVSLMLLILLMPAFAQLALDKPIEFEEKITYEARERFNFTTSYVQTIQPTFTKTGTKEVNVIDKWEVQLIPIKGDFPKDVPDASKYIRKRVPIYKTITKDVFTYGHKTVMEEVKIGVPYNVFVPTYELAEKKGVGKK